MGKILELTDASFGKEVLQSNIPVLVDFWAPWCGPCHAVAPAMEALAAEYDGRVKVAKLNVDQYQRVAGAMRIQSIPTVAIFHRDQLVDIRAGAQPHRQYQEMLEKALAVLPA